MYEYFLLWVLATTMNCYIQNKSKMISKITKEKKANIVNFNKTTIKIIS